MAIAHVSATQRDLTVAVYCVVWCATAGLVFLSQNFRDARVAALILLAGSLYPLAGKLLPGISRDDAVLRRDGLRELKAILVLLVVVLVAFQMLTDGFGGMSMKRLPA